MGYGMVTKLTDKAHKQDVPVEVSVEKENYMTITIGDKVVMVFVDDEYVCVDVRCKNGQMLDDEMFFRYEGGDPCYPYATGVEVW